MLKNFLYIIPLILWYFGSNAYGGQLTFLRPGDYKPSYILLPEYSQLQTMDLTGNWEYSSAKEEYTGAVKLPASWKNYTGKVTFSRKFKLSPADKSKKVTLIVEGLSRRGYLRLNDEIIAKTEGPNINLVLPNKLLKYERSNILEIEVDNTLHSLNTVPLQNGLLSPDNYGGITGDIFLILHETAALKSLQIQTRLSADYTQGVVEAAGEIDLPPTAALPGVLSWQITDPAGKIVFRKALSLNGSSFKDQAQLENPLRWAYLKPNLYTVEIFLEDAGGAHILSVRKTGFRSGIYDDGYKLNGESLRIQGITYYPVNQFGRTLPAEAMNSDLQMIMQSGANAILLTEPAPGYLYYLCDSLGLMILQCAALNAVPAAAFHNEIFLLAAENHTKSMTSALAHHPSICAWIAARNVEKDLPCELISSYFRLYEQIPCFIEIKSKPNYFLLLDREGNKFTHTNMVSGIGVSSFDQGENVQTRQAEEYMNLLYRYREKDGVILRSFADYWSGRAILFAGEMPDKRLSRSGLVGVDRAPKLIFHRLQDSWQLELPVVTSPAVLSEPVFFPIAGLIMVILFLLFYRSNKVFRLQLKRVYAHLHGFFVDIRSGRFIAKTQTLVVGGGAILIIAFILETYFYHARFSQRFDFFLGQILPNSPLQELLVIIIWSPLKAVVFLFLLLLSAVIISGIFFKITASIFRGKTEFDKCLIMQYWAMAPALLLLPVSIMFYKSLSYDGLRTVFLAFILLVLCWIFFRVVYGIKVASYGGMMAVFIVYTLMNLIFWGLAAAWLQYNTAFIQYWNFLFSAAMW